RHRHRAAARSGRAGPRERGRAGTGMSRAGDEEEGEGEGESEDQGAMSGRGLPFCRIAPDVRLGRDVKIYAFVNLYGCTIGDETRVGTFVEIQKNARVGARCKISSHTFICEGVTIEDEVFVGHGVMFINDLHPRATAAGGKPQTEA